jgi:hypothetical protein
MKGKKMPNWCDNSVTLCHDNRSKIDALEAALSSDKQEVFQHLRPNPTGEWDYGWSVENWGTKWDISVTDWERQDDNSIWISFNTAWAPPIALYEFLYDEEWQVEAFYNEGGMAFCGMFNHGCDESFEYSSDDLESIEALPDDLQEFTGLIDYYHDCQADREQEEHDAKCTEWFEGDIKPVHVGRYEAKDHATINWPFAEYANWDGKNWRNGDNKKIKVAKWRGLKEKPE